MRKLVIALALVGASHATLAHAAPAQDQAPTQAEPAPAPADATSGDIVVTAQRRSERLIDVPMSITAITGDKIVSSGITTTGGLAQISPGVVTVNNGFGFLPVIRGIQSTGTSPGDETNVAIYIDDVAIGTPIAGFFDLADIERIEILKGPQGTLYGRNATGGAIKIVTRQPSFTTSGSAAADFGFHYKEFKGSAVLTGPITDTLAGLVSGTYRTGEGFIKGIAGNDGRTYGAPNNYVVRGKLLWKAAPGLEATLAGDVWRQQNDSMFISDIDGGANPFPLIPGTIPSRPYTNAGSTQPKSDLKGWGLSFDVHWDVGHDIAVRSLTGYRHVDVQSQSDTDRTNQSIGANQISQRQDALSEELTIAGPSNSTLAWIVGAYYLNNKAANPYFRTYSGDAPSGTIVNAFTNHVTAEAIAGFGEATLNLAERFHLTGGIRYNSETKTFFWQNLLAPASVTNSQRTWNSTTWRAVARYDLADNANVYASVSTGFKSGVYNAYSSLDRPVNPENITAYEVGAKARVGGINLTLAGFAYEYKDIQVSSYSYVSINGGTPTLLLTLSNAASARMRGLEFSADGKLGGGFSFSAGLAWQPTSEYAAFTTAQVTVPVTTLAVPFDGVVARTVVPFDASGSRTVRTPEVTGNIRLSYDHELWGGDFSGNVNTSYQSSFFWQPGNLSREAPYAVVNFRLGWTKNRITYSVFGNNITDADYHTDLVPNVRGDSVKFIPKHEIGIGVAYKF